MFVLGQGIINNEQTAKAMLLVDRKNYAKGIPYQDAPQGIGYGVTISAPHMVISILLRSLLLMRKHIFTIIKFNDVI